MVTEPAALDDLLHAIKHVDDLLHAIKHVATELSGGDITSEFQNLVHEMRDAGDLLEAVLEVLQEAGVYDKE